jgi:two-component system response regulator VicR
VTVREPGGFGTHEQILTMPKRVLLLEDDPNLGFVLQERLESNGFRVQRETNGEDGLAAAKRGSFELCIVDVMMPKKDGFTFAREFRSKDSATPIIFLTAKALKEDRIEGFKIGGDDYITKPFSMEELLLRIQAVLKRSSSTGESIKTHDPITIGKFVFDEGKQLLFSKSRKQPLTSREAQLLSLLTQNQNSVVLRNDILKSLWNDDSYYNSRSLDVFISRLRKYLAADSTVQIISVHGKGYTLSTRV